MLKVENIKLTLNSVLFLTSFITPIILAILILKYSVNIPYWDQWDTPSNLLIKENLTWSDLFEQHNESRPLFPNLFFWYLAKLTDWNNKVEMLTTFILACITSINLFWLSKKSIPNSTQRSRDFKSRAAPSDAQHLICFNLTNLLIFNPNQYENWLWGLQSITFSSIVALSSSFVIIFNGTTWKLKILSSACFATLATFSFANGFLCWFILFLALQFQAHSYKQILLKAPSFKRITCIWSAIFFGVSLIYFYDFSTLSNSDKIYNR